MSIRDRLGLDRKMGHAELRANRILTRIGREARSPAEAQRMFAASVEEAKPQVRRYLLAMGEAFEIAAAIDRDVQGHTDQAHRPGDPAKDAQRGGPSNVAT